MKIRRFSIAAVLLVIVLIVLPAAGCGQPQQAPPNNGQQANQTGVLQFKANGEDFVRQGFTSKDGWKITFDNVYLHLSAITAYQTDPPYDAAKGGAIAAKQTVSLPGSFTVDLAEGGADAEPILVDELKDVAVGHYNAISWEMRQAAEGPSQGYALLIIGRAEKAGKTVAFRLGIDKQYRFTGGEYVGDERKGIVEAGETADLEMTFHFDHLFGDINTPADDELNTGALGFEPLAGLAQGGKVETTLTELKDTLPAAYDKLLAILPHLGHVGEGHCASAEI